MVHAALIATQYEVPELSKGQAILVHEAMPFRRNRQRLELAEIDVRKQVDIESTVGVRVENEVLDELACSQCGPRMLVVRVVVYESQSLEVWEGRLLEVEEDVDQCGCHDFASSTILGFLVRSAWFMTDELETNISD